MSSPVNWSLKGDFIEDTIQTIGYPPETTRSFITANLAYESGTRVKSKTVDYAYRKAHKIPLPLRPYTFTKLLERPPKYFSWTQLNGSKNYILTRRGYVLSTALITTDKYYPFSQADFDSYRNASTNKMLTKLKGSDVNLAVAFAERKQLANMFTSFVPRIAEAYLLLKRGKLRAATKKLGLTTSSLPDHFDKQGRIRKGAPAGRRQSQAAVHSVWLELQYGWRPLLDDIYGAAVAVAKSQLRESRNRVVTRKRYKGGDTTKIETQGARNVIREEIINRNYILETSTVAWFESASTVSATSLGLTNPAEVAWELMPYSFVIDWFLPLGNYLSMLDAHVGFKYITGSTTVYLYRSYDAVVTHNFETSLTGVTSGTAGGYKASGELIDVRREVHTTLPLPAFPEFKNPFSATHVANAIALLRNLTSKRS
jgi:hypothetical protein